MKGGGGGAFGRTGPDQRRPSGNRRDDFSYSSAAAAGGRPPHEHGRGGPGSGGGRNGSGATIPARPVHASWERDRSRERGDLGGPSWDLRERDRHRSGRGAAGGAEFGSDPLATAAMTSTGPVDTFGRALQPSAPSASASRASLGRSSSTAAAVAMSHTTDHLQSRSGRGGGKGGGGRDLPWKRDTGASASGANRPHTTPPLPAGGLPRATVAAAAAPRTHQSHQQQPPSSKNYRDYRHSVKKRSSRNAGGGAGGGGGGGAAGNTTQAAASAANLEKLKAFTAGNARTGDPTASAVTLAAAAKSTTISNSTIGPSTAAAAAAKPPGDVGGASAKNAPLPDMKAASAARKRQPTRNEMLRNAEKMKSKGQSKIKSIASVATSLTSKKATKTKHPPPGGCVAVSAARANAASTNRLLSAIIDKPSKKMLMAQKMSASEALAGGDSQYSNSTSSAAGSPKGKMETQKQPAQQAPSNKPPAKRVGRAAAAMSKENHTMAHQHAGPVEICAVGKQQHIGRILPTASIAPKFVEDTLVKLPGEGKGGKSEKMKAKPGTGKAKVANKVAAKAKAIKEQAIGKARALTRPKAAAVSKSASAGSSSPRRKVPVPPSKQASEKEKIGPSNASESASGKASFSRLEEAKAELEAKKRQQSMLENKDQESGAVSFVPRDDVAVIHAAKDKAKSTNEKKSEVVAGVSENGIEKISRQHANSSSVPSKGDDDDGPEEKKDDEPFGGATSKSVEAPEVILVDRVMQKYQLSNVKAASKDNNNAALSIDSDSAKTNKNDDVMSIGDSTDEDEKDTAASKKTSQKKSSPDDDSVMVIGSSSSSAAASSSSSDVVCMDDKKYGAKTEEREIWVCDICHIAEFSEEEDAVAHEKACLGRKSAANGIATAEAKTGNTTSNATDTAKPPDVPAAPETLAGPNGAADGMDGDYDSSDDERSLTMKPISRSNAFESSQSSSEGDGRSDIPATIDVKDPSSPRPYEKPMQETPMTLASDASNKDDDGIPAHTGTNPPSLSTKAKSSPLRDHYVGTSERLAMKASLEAKNGAKKRSLLGRTAAAGVLVDDSKKKQRRLSSSYENKKKKAPKLPPLTPLVRREPNELILMEAVPHLTRTELDDATGKPMHFITVYSSSMGKILLLRLLRSTVVVVMF